MALNEKDYEDIYNNSQGVIWDKSNYNNIVAYLQEITMFSLHLDGLKLQQHIREQVLNNSATLNIFGSGVRNGIKTKYKMPYVKMLLI